MEGQHVPDLWLQFAAPFKDTDICRNILAGRERNDTGAPPLVLSASRKHRKDKQVENLSHLHNSDITCTSMRSGLASKPPLSPDRKTRSPPPPQPGLLISHLSTAAQLMARVRDAPGLSHPPSPSCFSLLALLQSYHHCVSFVHTESCTFSSPHISLIHRLITHCRPCRPPRAQKNQSSFAPHSHIPRHNTSTLYSEISVWRPLLD